MTATKPLTIVVDAQTNVSGLWMLPPDARACFVFAHGAGAGMEHTSMLTVASELAGLRIATLRYQFPYMQRGSRRPDAPELCHATVRAAVAEAGRLSPSLPLIAGGRSFGGRMTSQAQALSPLSGVKGLAFLAFPLHSAGKPADTRARHLFEVTIPMLFLTGTRDELADMGLLLPVIQKLGKLATLQTLPEADHSFHVPARTGRKDPEIRAEALRAFAAWVDGLTGHA